jgi:hypothetical protein
MLVCCRRGIITARERGTGYLCEPLWSNIQPAYCRGYASRCVSSRISSVRRIEEYRSKCPFMFHFITTRMGGAILKLKHAVH